MNETELERMVVRLMGDGSSYVNMCRTAESASTQAAQVVGTATKQIEAFGTGLKGFAANALGALAVFGVASSANSAFDKFADREKVLLRLTAAIESNGRAVGPVMADYMAFADAISAQTLTTKGSTLAMLKQVEAMGFSGDAAKRVISNSIAMAAVNDGSAENYLRVTAAMEQGNLQLLRRIPGLRGIKNETELVMRAQQMLASGMKIAQAEAQSTSGQIAQLKRSLGALSIEVGGLIASAIQPVVAWLRRAVDAFNALDPATKKVIVGITAALAAVVSFGPLLGTLAPLFGVLLGPVKMFAGLLMGIPSLWATIGTAIRLAVGLIGPLLRVVLALVNPIKLVGLAFTVLSGVLGVIAGVVGAIFSPWTIALAVVAAGVAVLVNRLGGLAGTWKAISDAAGVAWEWMEKKTAEFMVWARPVFLALESFANTAWKKIQAGIDFLWTWGKQAFAQARDFVVDVWRRMVGTALPSWEQIRDAIRDAIIVAEYALQNLDDVAMVTWLAMRYGWTVFSEEFAHFFTGTLPALMGYFRDNWRTVFDWLVDTYDEANAVMAENTSRVIGAAIDWVRENWKPLFTWLGDAGVAVMQGLGQATIDVFKSVLPWLSNNWQGIFKGIADYSFDSVDYMTLGLLSGFGKAFGKVFDYATDTFKQIGNNVATLFKALPDIMAGKTSFAEVWAGLKKEYEGTVKELKPPEIKTPEIDGFKMPTIGGVKIPDMPKLGKFEMPELETLHIPDLNLPEIKLPKRMIGDLEKSIREEFEILWEDLGVDFKEFRDAKLKEFAANIPESVVAQAKREAEALGSGIGQAFTKGISGKFDAAIADSAEALTRLAEYRDRLDYGIGGDKARQGIFAGAGGGGQRFDATQARSAEGAAREESSKAQLDELRKINETLREKLKADTPEPLPVEVVHLKE